MLPQYQINVIDWTGNLQAVYDGTSVYDLKYGIMLNDVGALAMAIPWKDGLSSLFALDTFVEVMRTSPVTGRLAVAGTYMVRMTNPYRDGDEERFLVGGVSLEHLILRKIVDPDDDPAQVGGYSTKAGPADQLIHDYCYDQMANSNAARRVPNFTIGPIGTVGISTGQRLRHDNLLKVCQGLAKQGGVDFQIVRTSGNNLRMNILPIGSNKTMSYNYPGSPFVLLSRKRGNLTNPSLKLDRSKEENFVYIKGQGQGNSRLILKLGHSTVIDSPYNRIEYAEDARSSEKASALTLFTEGKTSLADNIIVAAFDFQPNAQEPGNVYGLDWIVGDQVTVTWDNITYFNLRITGVELDINERGETIKVKVEQVNV